MHWPVRRGPLRPCLICTHCRHVRRRVHRGLLLPRWLLLCHAKPMPAGHLRRRHGANHRRLHRAVRRGLLWVLHRPNCGIVQRSMRVWHVRRHHGAHCFHLHGPVHCGSLRSSRICTHRRHMRWRVHRGLLLPRGVVHRNGGTVPRGLLLPRGRWCAHCLPRGLLLPRGRRCAHLLHCWHLLLCSWRCIVRAVPRRPLLPRGHLFLGAPQLWARQLLPRRLRRAHALPHRVCARSLRVVGFTPAARAGPRVPRRERGLPGPLLFQHPLGGRLALKVLRGFSVCVSQSYPLFFNARNRP